jgi:cob(I)alamin adenosyltransferase
MASSFYTRLGDHGTTGILGPGRVPKFDVRIEALGTLDEANAALGLARSFCQSEGTADRILKIQRSMYTLMTEVAAPPETAERYRFIAPEDVHGLEELIDDLSQKVTLPGEFIVPGDSPAGAYLDLARTIIRRAERRTAELADKGGVTNPNLLPFLNRLSSLCFVLEIYEIGQTRPGGLTLANTDTSK